ELTSYAGEIAEGRPLMFVILLATAVALFGRTVDSAAGAMLLLGAALFGLLPPALTGHAAASGNHELAVTGLALHLVAISGSAAWPRSPSTGCAPPRTTRRSPPSGSAGSRCGPTSASRSAARPAPSAGSTASSSCSPPPTG